MTDELAMLKDHFESMPVDGWVEIDALGMLYVEVFAKAVAELNLKHGQFVRIQVYDKPTQARLGHDGQI